MMARVRYTVYDSSLQGLSLLTLCRRLGKQSGRGVPGIVPAQRAGEAGSDFTWADLSKAQWGLD